ncbi:MAG: rod shape-determining protein RodA [Schleiferiaceae bacterium]|nr:rod shape-determining protein RodA [Schleiferiaceae bacterium]
MRESKSIFSNIDWLTVFLWLVLCLLGWMNVYAAVYNEEHQSIFDTTQKYGKQLLWIITAMVIGISILAIDGRFYEKFSYPIFILVLLSLVAVLFFGTKISGARSWFTFGSFSIQPSEFAKFAVSLALAKFLSTSKKPLTNLSMQLKTAFIALLPAAVILPQPDAGSALVFSALIFPMYREGLPGAYIGLGLSMIFLFVISLMFEPLHVMFVLGTIGVITSIVVRKNKKALLVFIGATLLAIGFVASVDYTFDNLLEDRHRNRINILLGKAHDPQGIGYNTNQSKIAVGSGGLWGKGFLNGTQTKYEFVPEQETDFIFCTVGEEWGFVGSMVVILLFLTLLFRLVFLAERQKSTFSRVYGYSVVGILFVHFFINIAMVIGVIPVIGIPLPFFSYGGSALWGFTLLLFIFIKLDAYRKVIL